MADFYLDHMIIQEPGQFEEEQKVEDQGGSQEITAEDEGDVDELILDLLRTGDHLLQTGYKVFLTFVEVPGEYFVFCLSRQVTDIFFTFDLDLHGTEEEEEDNDEGEECLWAAVGQLNIEDQAGNDNAEKEEPDDTKEQEEEGEEEEEVMKLLLFYVEMSSKESKEVAIVQLNDLRLSAPEQLLKFLESNIDIKSDDEEESEDSDGQSEDLGTI